MGRGKVEQIQPPFKPEQCEACHGRPDLDRSVRLHFITVERQEVRACVEPVPCRLRAERAGLYKVV